MNDQENKPTFKSQNPKQQRKSWCRREEGSMRSIRFRALPMVLEDAFTIS